MSDRCSKYVRIRRRGMASCSGARSAKRRRHRSLRGGTSRIINSDLISNLPVDVGQRILNELHPFDLLRASRVCRAWRGLVASILWQRIAQPGVTLNQSRLFQLYGESYMSWCRKPIDQSLSSVHCPVGVESSHGVFCLCFTRDGKEFIANNARSEVITVDTSNGQTLYQFKEVFSCSLYAAPIIYLAWIDIIGFDCESRQCIRMLKGHKATVLCMQIQDGLLVSGSEDCTVRLWDTAGGCVLAVLAGHVAPVNRVIFKKKLIISASSDGIAKVWTQQSLKCLHTLNIASGGGIVHPRLHFDGSYLAFLRDHAVEVWKVDDSGLFPLTGLRSEQVKLKATSVKFIRFTDCLAVGFEDGSIQIWNLVTGRIKMIANEVKTDPDWQAHFNHSVDGFLIHYEFIICWTRSGVINLHDRVTGNFIRCLLNLPHSVVTGGTDAIGKVVGICAHKCKMVVVISIGIYGSRFKMYDFTPRNLRADDRKKVRSNK